MNYIYDVLANFNDVFFEFFDWYSNDSIVHIKKLPILKISSDFFNDIKINSIKVDSSFLDKIFRKSEFFKASKNKYSYVCCLCDGCDAIIGWFDSKGHVLGKSDMLIDEKNEVIDVCNLVDCNDYNYILCSKNDYKFFNTRRENQINNFLVNELNSMSSDKLRYLYFDCFSEHENDVSVVVERLIYEINTNFSSVYENIYGFLKLTSINK